MKKGTHVVDVDGVAQRYHVRGQGAAVLVAMPGGPGVDWDSLLMPEVERHLTVVYVEPIGTGESGRLPEHPHGYSRDAYAAALDRVIDDLGREKVYLLGHSHGGFVAQYYAARHPQKLAGLVLYDSAPVTGAEQGEETMRQLAAFAARNEGNPELPGVLAALQTVGSITDDDRLTEALRGLLPAYFAHYWERESEFKPIRDRLGVAYIADSGLVQDRELLAGLTVPTLAIAGRYDVICGERWAREIADLVPGSKLLILVESGHLGHIEEPEKFATALTDFVAATK
ncbi:alpha/beta fold hydrolase [Paractinoplanes maris]|uniref:alpha/beta fold hydrolase n=1 Tax=Paractinoplanes maris TaxID=1734446 RepID=UPI002021C34A|nr:alpha/beta hydrolase [Actinoplanes maris]